MNKTAYRLRSPKWLMLVSLTLATPIAAADAASAGILRIGWMADPQRADSVAIYRQDEALYLDLRELADRLSIKLREDAPHTRLLYHLAAHQLLFTAGTPFVSTDGELKQLSLAVRYGDERWLAPLEALISLLAGYHPGELLYDPSEPRLLVSQPRFDLFGIHYRVSAGKTWVLIPAAALFDCRLDTLKGGAVRLFFPSASADVARLRGIKPAGLVDGCEVRSTADGTEISFQPAEDGSFAGFERESDPPLYALKFVAGTLGLDPEARKRLEEEREKWKLDLVVIDPGHGGQDPGAVGPGRVYEKDITLDVGKRLDQELKKRGIRTVMTRDKDVFIPLHERTRIANTSGGKLFISLHCNANPDRRAKGIESYFLAPAKNEKAMKVAMRENSVIKYEDSKDQYRDLTEENYILLQMAQANYARESQDLAGTLQQVVPAGLNMKSRGVDQAGFYVLIGASMPAVLFEMAFLSNPDEEKKLKTKQFRQQMAERIADAVERFLKENREEGLSMGE